MSTEIKEGAQAKAIWGVLFRREAPCVKLYDRIAAQGWEIQHRSAVHPFDLTSYYTREMGANLSRFFLSLKGLFPQIRLVSMKKELRKWEDEWRIEGQRTINLDPGYLDLHKVVLLSSKEGPQKIHLCEGVWADLNLLRKGGAYQSLPWTFPDLRDGRYSELFEKTRETFKQELSETHCSSHTPHGNQAASQP